jgi:hypothetical protein
VGSIPIARSTLVGSHWPRVVLGGALARLFVSKVTMRPSSDHSVRNSEIQNRTLMKEPTSEFQ